MKNVKDDNGNKRESIVERTNVKTQKGIELKKYYYYQSFLKEGVSLHFKQKVRFRKYFQYFLMA